MKKKLTAIITACALKCMGGEIQGSPAVYRDILVIGTCSKDNAFMYGIKLQ